MIIVNKLVMEDILMETQEKMEREINLMELFWNILFSWRQILCFTVCFSILISGVKYVKDIRNYETTQNVEIDEIDLTADEQAQVEDAKIMMQRVENYEKYLNESALMQINPYIKPVIDLQYYVESDYTYNYTKDNRSDYTEDLMALYFNYVKSGEISNKIIEDANLPISQADFSELCYVSLNQKTMAIQITWSDEEKLEEISKILKSELSKKENEFQDIGTHKLKLLRESKNVIADTELAEKKNTFATNVTTINTQLDTLKKNMSEEQLKQLQDETDLEKDKTEVIAKPGFSYRYMIVGGFLGAFLLCCWIACKVIFAAKLQNPEEIRTLYNIRLLGEIDIYPDKKRFLSVIDDKLLAIKNRRKKKLAVEQQIKVIAANISLSCKKQNIEQIYMTGSEYENLDVKILNMLKEELIAQKIQVSEGENIFYDADSMKQGTEIGNILFMEQIGKSIYDEISNELNLAKEQKNNIIGVVVVV